MKIDGGKFSHLEGKRQKYIRSFEEIPYLGGLFAACFFIGFAIWTPLHSKLYKESLASLFMGLGLASTFTYAKRRTYLQEIDLIYNELR